MNDFKLIDAIKSVEEFHNCFNIKNNNKPTVELEEGQAQLRYDLMKEETEEYLEAVKNDDLVEVADALGDQLYILCGTILKHGLQDKIVAVFEEIHRSNMSKLGEDGMPIYREDGKVLKGKNYFRPNIQEIIS